WLVKRLAWRLQALAEGDLSQRARQRAAELANDANLRLNPPRGTVDDVPPRTATGTLTAKGDERLPQLASVPARASNGERLQVHVLPAGFAYQGQIFKSLSAVARAITGTHCNGFLFFRLTTSPGAPP